MLDMKPEDAAEVIDALLRRTESDGIQWEQFMPDSDEYGAERAKFIYFIADRGDDGPFRLEIWKHGTADDSNILLVTLTSDQYPEFASSLRRLHVAAKQVALGVKNLKEQLLSDLLGEDE